MTRDDFQTSIEFTPEARAILAGLQALPDEVKLEMARALEREQLIAVGQIQRNRFSSRGAHSLGVDTNRLRMSIRGAKVKILANGIVGGIGSNVRYLGVHEFGFNEPVTVKAHTRRVASRNSDRQSGVTTVKSHTRKMNTPERAPLRHGVEDQIDELNAALSTAIVTAWNNLGQGGQAE